MKCVTLPLAALLFATTAASAQLTSTVGPPIAPPGCAISISISNDTAGTAITGLCPFTVFDNTGSVVYQAVCFPIAIQMPPGGTHSTEWLQIDDLGAQVPPGTYGVNVDLPDGSFDIHIIEIVPVDAALSMLGAAKTGTQRRMQLCSPGDPDGLYVLAASLSSAVGIPTCGGTIPLDLDTALKLSLSPTSPIFLNFSGSLDSAGVSDAPELAVPDLASFVGLQLEFGFIVLDFFQPCPVVTISEPLPVVII